MDVNKKWNTIVLGSQSPRRKELLKGLNIEFEVRVADIDESFPDSLETEKVAEYIAINKLKALAPHANSNELIICSDTIVVLKNEILGKPTDRVDATRMLEKLSGQTHTVITSVAMSDGWKDLVFSDETKVTFKNLTKTEIKYYLDNYMPYDKAGSYGVQEWIGMVAITKMEGSYFTVMGFPVHKVYEAMVAW
jgi:septum formation protein